MTEQAIAAFQQNLRGRVIQPTDADYDAVRAYANGMIDKRPRLIARCIDTADVIAAVNFARDQNVLWPFVAAATTDRAWAAVTTGS